MLLIKYLQLLKPLYTEIFKTMRLFIISILLAVVFCGLSAQANLNLKSGCDSQKDLVMTSSTREGRASRSEDFIQTEPTKSGCWWNGYVWVCTRRNSMLSNLWTVFQSKIEFFLTRNKTCFFICLNSPLPYNYQQVNGLHLIHKVSYSNYWIINS